MGGCTYCTLGSRVGGLELVRQGGLRKHELRPSEGGGEGDLNLVSLHGLHGVGT